MKQTLGDYWRKCDNEELATNMVDFLMELMKQMDIPIEEIDWEHEYNVFLSFFNTEYEVDGEESIGNKFTYVH